MRGARIWLPRALAAAAVVALVVVLASGFRHDPRDFRTGIKGKPAPEFTLERLDGAGTLSLRDFAGKAVVLNYFASWCIPCKAEHLALSRAWERYRGTDVVIIGVLWQDSREAGRDFQRRLGGTWPAVVDDTGRTAISYGVVSIPETFFIRPDGIIEGRHIGEIDEATLVKGIETIRTAARSR